MTATRSSVVKAGMRPTWKDVARSALRDAHASIAHLNPRKLTFCPTSSNSGEEVSLATSDVDQTVGQVAALEQSIRSR
jgi:hypothetical protein